ncbi:hypothetical protein V8E51_004931 [Hyaloscypha variabilis]
MDQTTTTTMMATTVKPVALTTSKSPSIAPSTVLTTVNLPDFEAEYEKVKQNLSFFEDAIAKKKELDGITKSIEKHKKQLEEVNAKLEAACLDFSKKNTEYTAHLPAFRFREIEWEDRDVDPDDVLYIRNLSGHAQKLRDRIRLARANLAMLEESLLVEEQRVAIEAIRKQVVDLERISCGEGQLLEKLEMEEKTLRPVYEKAVALWQTKCHDSFSNQNRELQSTLEEKDSEIAQLKTQILSLNSTIDAKTKIIIAKEGLDLWKQPIIQVALDILASKQEEAKPKEKREEAIIEQGNKAAHNGTALADARRLLLDSPKRNAVEWTWYKQEYGASPEIVSQIGSDSPKTLEILDWNFSIRSFGTQHNDLKEEFELLFNKFGSILMNRQVGLNNALDMNTYLESSPGKKLYDKLKSLYIEAKQYRESYML